MNPKILLIEDEKEISELYKLKFSLSGYAVATVEDGARAMSEIEKELPDLILLDILIPNKDGFEILKEIKKNKDPKIKSIPVIMLSNLSNKQDIEEAKKMGAEDYIIKAKIDPKDMVEKIDLFFKK
jgi:two-component system, OmpR family, response regulator VicR